MEDDCICGLPEAIVGLLKPVDKRRLAKVDKPCCDCGKKMEQVSPQQQRCPECKKIHIAKYEHEKKRTTSPYKEVGIINIKRIINK